MGIGKESSVYLHVASHEVCFIVSLPSTTSFTFDRFVDSRRVSIVSKNLLCDNFYGCGEWMPLRDAKDRIELRVYTKRAFDTKNREVSLMIEVREEIAFSAKRLE